MKKTGLKLKMLAIFTSLAFTTQAQEQAVKNKRETLSGGFGHFTFSGQQLNLNNLNGMLNTLGFNSLSNNYLSFGGGGGFVFNNFFIGGEGGSLATSNTSNLNSTLSFKAGCGYFNFGYIVHSTKRSVLYPIVGVGGGGYTMNVNSKNVNSNFQDQLNTPNGGATLQGGGLMINSQLCYQYFFVGHEKEGLFLGLKAGYRYCPTTWKMSVNGSHVNNAPGLNMNGAYVSIILGGGSLTNCK
jgi:hypothetical protein